MLNVGLLTPKQIIYEAINYGLANDVGLNSIEGFIRQIIGWREFIRGVYVFKGTQERSRIFGTLKTKFLLLFILVQQE